VSDSATPALLFNDIFAAGGNVTIHAQDLAGGGSITAHGSPTISISNASNYDLYFNALNIPDNSGGNVFYTGLAAAAPTGMQVQDSTANAPGVIRIDDSASVSGSPAPNIFLNGAVENLGGQIQVTNQSGSIFQFGDVSGAQVTLYAPNGTYVVNDPGGFYQVSSPISAWSGVQWFPASINDAIEYVANSVFDGAAHAADFTGYLLNSGTAGDTSVLFYNLGNNSAGTNPAPSVYTYQFHGAFYYQPVLVESLYRSAAYQPAGSTSAATFGGEVAINARYVDVNGEIRSGRYNDWSVNLDSAIAQQIGSDQSAYDAHGGPSLYTLSGLQVYAANCSGCQQQVIGAQYDAVNKQIILSSVNSGGGGYVLLQGDILSTTQSGHVTVSDGYGHVYVGNSTGVPVVVDNISTGNANSAEVKIVDTARTGYQGRPLTSWYVYRLGDGLYTYDNANNGASELGGCAQLGACPEQLSYSPTATTASYDPLAGQRYQWTETTYLGRTYTPPSSNWFQASVSNWVWTDDSGASTGGQPIWYTSSQVLQGQDNSNPNQFFTENISGSYGYYTENVQYHKGNWGFPEPPNPWHYHIVDWATLTLTSSIDASNPIGIDFTGNPQGSITVDSDATVSIAGRLYNPGGPTSITSSQGSITQTAQGSVDTQGLDLQAASGIGSAGQALQVSLNGGALQAASSTGDVDINATGELPLLRVAAGGAINLSAQGSIVAAAGAANPLLSASSISLDSISGGIGSSAQALDVQGLTTVDAYGATVGGLVNASAQGDIVLQAPSGDLRVGSVVSSGGNVSLSAPGGALVNGLQGSNDTTSLGQAENTWKTLGLLDTYDNVDYGGQAAVQADTIKPYEQQVDRAYQSYWQLRAHASVGADGTVSLDSAQQQFFTPMVQALGIASPSAAQLTSYVQQQYDAATQTLAQALGSGWAQLAPLQAYQQGFQYSAPQSVVDQLSYGGVWTPSELLYQINADALKPGAGAGQFLAQAANVSGSRIDLGAGVGIGSLSQPVTIVLPPPGQTLVLDASQSNALASAQAPGDVSVVYDGSGQATALQVQQTTPLVVDPTQSLAAQSGGAAFLQSTGDLTLRGVSAQGNAQLLAQGSIAGASAATQPLIQATGSLDLQSLAGALGSAATPLSLDIGGALGSASARDGMYLTQTQGDLVLGNLYAGGPMVLAAPQGSLLSDFPAGNDALHIQGDGISLQAAGSLGAPGMPLLLDAGSGVLSGSASQAVVIDDPQGSLDVASLRSSAGGIALSTAGDLLLGQLQSGLQQGDAFALFAGGNLLADGSPGTQLTAESAAAQAVLDAGAGIGASTRSLQVMLPQFSASAGGDLFVHDLESAQVPTLVAAGDAALQVDGTLGFGQAQAGGSLLLSAADDLQGSSAQATQATLTASQGSLQLGTLTAQQAQLAALDDISLAQAWIAHTIDLFANNSVQATVAQRGADTALTVGLAGQPPSGVVRQVGLNLDAPNGVNFDPLRVYAADLSIQSPDISVRDGYVVGSLRLSTPEVSLLMDNLDPRLQSVDVQLYQPGQDFLLLQQGRSTYTSAFVEHYFNPYQVTVPNFDSSHTSAYPDFQGSSADSYASGATLLQRGLALPIALQAPPPSGPTQLFQSLVGGQVDTSTGDSSDTHRKHRHG
jgi:hypothetical protein